MASLNCGVFGFLRRFTAALLLYIEHDRSSCHHSAPSNKLAENVLGLTRALLTQPVSSFSSCGVEDACSRVSARLRPGDRKQLILVLGV